MAPRRAPRQSSAQAPDADARGAPPPVGPAFVLTYAAAEIGAFLGFIPLLSILLPLKIQALAPEAKIDVLSPVLAVGAVEASLVNVLAGWLSDRGRSRGGDRSGWLVIGALGLALSLLLIGAAATVLEVAAALLLLQVFANVLLAPLTAVLADRVPDAQKGRMAGWLSIGHPVATLVGTGLVGGVVSSTPARYGLLALLVCAGVLPFAGVLRRQASIARPPRPAPTDAGAAHAAPGWPKPFYWLWAARFAVQCAIAPVSAYLLYYVEDVLGLARRPETAVALLLSLSTVAALVGGPVVGYLAHRGRRPLALLTGAMMAAGLAMLALGGAPRAPMLALVLFGAGFGGFTALDTALAGELAGRAPRAGRDLGLLNLAHTAPQVITPAWAWLMLRPASGGYAGLFGSAALFSLLGALFFVAADAGGAAAEPRTTS